MDARQYTRIWLKENGITQNGLSRMVGMKRAYVSNWLSGGGGEYGPITRLNPVVQYPPEMVEQARKLNQEACRNRTRNATVTTRYLRASRLGDTTAYDPQPWPMTVANLKANPPIYNWCTA